MAVGDAVTLGVGGCLADKLVEIGSTVAIADSIALELVSAPKAEWQDYTLVDTDDVGDTPFAHEAVVGTLLARLAYDRDVACIGVGWPQYHHFWVFSMDFERLAGLTFLLEPHVSVPGSPSRSDPSCHN